MKGCWFSAPVGKFPIIELDSLADCKPMIAALTSRPSQRKKTYPFKFIKKDLRNSETLASCKKTTHNHQKLWYNTILDLPVRTSCNFIKTLQLRQKRCNHKGATFPWIPKILTKECLCGSSRILQTTNFSGHSHESRVTIGCKEQTQLPNLIRLKTPIPEWVIRLD